MSVPDQLTTMRMLGQGQKVRMTIDSGDTLAVRVNQMEYDPESHFRVEFTSDESGDHGRYQADASVDDGQWTELSVKRYDRADRNWITIGGVVDAVPLEMFRTMRSSDMDAQQNTADTESPLPR